MNKTAVVETVLSDYRKAPLHKSGTFFAPSNIALCKYWGKRNTEINLPVTSSLSVGLGYLGAKTTVTVLDNALEHEIIVNEERMKDSVKDKVFTTHLIPYLNLFKFDPTVYFKIETTVNLPIGAGLASSACGYAALIGALDKLYGWQLSLDNLSLLARLGSGSACRSFWPGFVEWTAGVLENGMDSRGVPLDIVWPELCMGLLIVSKAPKAISSRKAMEITRLTSPFYAIWPKQQAKDLTTLKQAIAQKNFNQLGEVSELNALSMHAMMMASNPPILYANADTVSAMHDVWAIRASGIPVYFTQDAGPNLKLLFLEKDAATLQLQFPDLLIIRPFGGTV